MITCLPLYSAGEVAQALALPPTKVKELFTLYLLASTPWIPAMITLVLSPSAGVPQRLLASISISKAEPAVKSQPGCILKLILKLRLFTSEFSVIDPGKLPPGNISVRSKIYLSEVSVV